MPPMPAYDTSYEAIAQSRFYRQAVRVSCPDLPDWVVPFSITAAEYLTRVAHELGIGNGDEFLDLGCGAGGPGLWVAERTGARLVGVDFSAVAVRLATALSVERGISDRARFIVADATATGLPDASFDGVMSIEAVMFIEPETAIAEIRRLLKPGGRVVMKVAESLVEPFLPTLVRDYRPLFEAAGFTILTHEEIRDYREHSLAFFRALHERSAAFRAEVGDLCENILGEARERIAQASQPPRARVVHMVAQRG